MSRFIGLKAVILGGATGIGRATAERIHDEEGQVVIADLNHEDGLATARHLGGEFVYTDVRQEEDLYTLAAQHTDTDVLIYSAGAQVAAPIHQVTDEEIRYLFDVNSFGVIWTAKHFGMAMARRDTVTSITFVASVGGLTSGGPGLAPYGSSKGACISFTKSAALEYAPYVRVNCVCPGWTDTPFNEPVIEFMGGEEQQRDTIVTEVPLQRQAHATEIAAAIAFIASPDASYMTGHVLVVDGGLSL